MRFIAKKTIIFPKFVQLLLRVHTKEKIKMEIKKPRKTKRKNLINPIEYYLLNGCHIANSETINLLASNFLKNC